MRLRAKTCPSENDGDRGLVVSCPQRTGTVSITECAGCAECLGLELDSGAFVRCGIAASEPRPGESAGRLPALAVTNGELVTILGDATLGDAEALMRTKRVSALAVVDADGRPVGLLTEGDLVRDASRSSALRVRDRMAGKPRTCDARTSLARVAAILANDGVEHVVAIAADGRVAGMISTLDVVRWVASQGRFVPGTLVSLRR